MSQLYYLGAPSARCPPPIFVAPPPAVPPGRCPPKIPLMIKNWEQKRESDLQALPVEVEGSSDIEEKLTHEIKEQPKLTWGVFFLRILELKSDVTGTFNWHISNFMKGLTIPEKHEEFIRLHIQSSLTPPQFPTLCGNLQSDREVKKQYICQLKRFNDTIIKLELVPPFPEYTYPEDPTTEAGKQSNELEYWNYM